MFQIPYQKDSKFLDDCPVILPLAPMKRVLFAAECILSFLEGNLATVRLIYVQHILAIPLLGFHPTAMKAPVHKDKLVTMFIQHCLGTLKAEAS